MTRVRWRKSSYSESNGHCVEVTGWWRKPSRCQNGECVEVAELDALVGVRDSKDPGPVLRFTPDEWRAFLGGVRSREFDHFGR